MAAPGYHSDMQNDPWPTCSLCLVYALYMYICSKSANVCTMWLDLHRLMDDVTSHIGLFKHCRHNYSPPDIISASPLHSFLEHQAPQHHR